MGGLVLFGILLLIIAGVGIFGGIIALFSLATLKQRINDLEHFQNSLEAESRRQRRAAENSVPAPKPIPAPLPVVASTPPEPPLPAVAKHLDTTDILSHTIEPISRDADPVVTKPDEHQSAGDVLSSPASSSVHTAPASQEALVQLPQTIATQPTHAGQPSIDQSGTERHDGQIRWDRFEDLVGRRWMAWLGAIIIFVSAGFAVRISIAHHLLGPWTRLIGGALLTIAVIVTGDILVRRGWRAFGEGVLGLGLLLGYACLFAAYQPGPAHILDQGTAFAAMVVVTACGVWRSVRHDAMPIAVLATIGGLVTPILLSNGSGNRDGFLAYLMLLDVGVLATAVLRRWRLLDCVAFVGTEVMVFLWWYAHDFSTGTLPMALWAIGFWLIFGGLAVAYRLRWRSILPAESYALSVANAVTALLAIHTAMHADPYLEALFPSLMALGYLVVALRAQHVFGGDSMARGSFAGLAASCLAVTSSLMMGGPALTAAWSAEAVMLAFLCRRYSFAPHGMFALILLAVVYVVSFTSDTSGIRTEYFAPSYGLELLIPPIAGIAVAMLLKLAAVAPWQAQWSGWIAMSAPLGLVVRLTVGRVLWNNHGMPHEVLDSSLVSCVACVCSCVLTVRRGGWWVQERLVSALGLLTWAAVSVAVLAFEKINSEAPGSGESTVFAISIVLVTLNILFITRMRWPTDGVAMLNGAAWWTAAGWQIFLITQHGLTAVSDAYCALGWASTAIALIAVSRWLKIAMGSALFLILIGIGLTVTGYLCGGDQDDSARLTISGLVGAVALAYYGFYGASPIRVMVQAAAMIWTLIVLHLDLGRVTYAGGGDDFAAPMTIAGALWLGVGLGALPFARLRPALRIVSACSAGELIVSSLIGYVSGNPASKALIHPHFIEGCGGLALLLWLSNISQITITYKGYWAAIAWGWLLLTIEAISSATALGYGHLRLVAVTIAWSLCASVVLACGFYLSQRAMRLAALALFGLTVLKLVIFDLHDLQDFARILSFMVAGVLLMAGSWAYQWLEARMRRKR